MALQVFSGKVTPEVAEQFKAAQENSEAQTFNAFMEMLLEAFLNPKTKPVPTPTEEQAQALQLKDNEIGRLQTNCSLIESTNQELKNEILKLKNRTAELEARNAELENNPAPAPALELADDQIIVTIPPIMSSVLDIEKEVAEKKTRKPWTVGDLLLNNFWESIKNGVSYPFRIWSSTELANLAKQIKEIEAEPQQ